MIKILLFTFLSFISLNSLEIVLINDKKSDFYFNKKGKKILKPFSKNIILKPMNSTILKPFKNKVLQKLK